MKKQHAKKINWKKVFWKIVNITFRTITFTAFVSIVLSGLALAYAYTVGGKTDALWMICGIGFAWFSAIGLIVMTDKVTGMEK